MKKTRKLFQNIVITGVVGWLMVFVFLPNIMIIATSFLTRDDANLVEMVLHSITIIAYLIQCMQKYYCTLLIWHW